MTEEITERYVKLLLDTNLLAYYNISGCYILRPGLYKMWEKVEKLLNIQFEKLKIENAYFPLLVTKGALEKETEHLKGFSPEVAWVTKYGNVDKVAEKKDDKEDE